MCSIVVANSGFFGIVVDTETLFDLRQQRRRKGILGGRLFDDVAQFSVKLKSLLTVSATLEVLSHLVDLLRSQLVVEKAIEFAQCFDAISHVISCPSYR